MVGKLEQDMLVIYAQWLVFVIILSVHVSNIGGFLPVAKSFSNLALLIFLNHLLKPTRS